MADTLNQCSYCKKGFPEFCECGKPTPMRPSEIRVNDDKDMRQKLHDAVVHGLRHYFSDHGDMKLSDIGSATKRIMGKVEAVSLPKREYGALMQALEKIGDLDEQGNPIGCQSHLECIHTAQEALSKHE